MALKFYAYKNCESCRKARWFLESHGIPFEELEIRENPPSRGELHRMLGAREGKISSLFNSSGRDYREMRLKDKVPEMETDELLRLLAGNGRLVKRPFLIGEKVAAVGFNEDEWQNLLL